MTQPQKERAKKLKRWVTNCDASQRAVFQLHLPPVVQADWLKFGSFIVMKITGSRFTTTRNAI